MFEPRNARKVGWLRIGLSHAEDLIWIVEEAVAGNWTVGKVLLFGALWREARSAWRRFDLCRRVHHRVAIATSETISEK